MTSVVEKIEALTYKLTITVPAEEMENAVRSRVRELSKTVNMKGFRPGKVPENVVESRFGGSVRQEIAGKLIQSSFEKAVEEHKLRVAGMPKIEPKEKDLKKGEPLIYDATVEVLPEIQLKDLEGVKVEKTIVDISDADVNTMIDHIRTQHSDWQTVDRASQEKDRVTFDFEGSVDGEKFEGGAAKDFQLIIGSKQMIPGFEEGLVGLKPGDTKDLKVKFPDQYPAENLKGKDAVFAIELHKVEEPKLPELNDEFVKKIGIEGGIEALKRDVREKMEQDLKQNLQEKLKAQVVEKLVELNPIEIPQSLVDQEIEHLQAMARQEMAMYQGKDKAEHIHLPKEPYIEQAKRRVIVGLLLAEVIKTNDIKVDREKVKEHINLMVASYQDPEQVAAWYHKNPRMMSEIEAIVLENQAIDRLLEKALIDEKTESYDKLVKGDS